MSDKRVDTTSELQDLKHGDGPGEVIYITKNTEYHVDGKLCIAVCDRSTHKPIPNHRGLFRRVCGGIVSSSEGVKAVEPEIGRPLYLFPQDPDEAAEKTTPVIAIERS